MFRIQAGLDIDKSNELNDALDATKPWASGPVKQTLQGLIHPLTAEINFALPQAAPETGNANLIVVQHKESGVVQFIFPTQPQQQQPVAAVAGDDQLQTFSLFRPFQLGEDLLDAEKWLVHATLNLPQTLATDAIVLAAHAVEASKKTEGLINLAKGYDVPATDLDLAQAKGKKVLIFVHGIFSSIKGAFNDLGDVASPSTMKKLVETYQGNVFGYDHWTICKTPLQNALDLLDAIPAGAGWDVDVVCHSRGGLVVRSLFALATNGFVPQNAGLSQIDGKRSGKINSVGNCVFVAAANQGSQLANPDDICNFLNMAAFLASKSACFALDTVIRIAGVFVSAVFDVPSVEQLATTSPLVSDLNQMKSMMDNDRVFGARADFDYAQSVLLETGVLLDSLLMKVDNDLVVPYDGVAQPLPAIAASRLLPFGSPAAKQGKVWHTEFFGQPKTQDFLTTNLQALQ